MATPSSYKVVVMGAAGVGKTCFIVQLVSGKFVEAYDPTLEDSYRKQIAVEGKEYMLDIFDTAGQEDFSYVALSRVITPDSAVRDSYMSTGDGFIIMYSIIDLKSFSEVKTIHTKLNMIQESKKVPGIVVGNKCDADDSRQVTAEQGKSVASDFGWGFMEASAKLKKNINEAFQEITKRMVKGTTGGDDVPGPSTRRRSGCTLL